MGKKGMKKVVAWIMMLSIMATSLVACGNAEKGNEEKTEAPAAESTQAQKDAEAEQPSGDTEKELTTLKVLGINYQFTAEGGKKVTLKDWATDGKSQRWQQLTEDLAERGIKLELDLIESDQYTTTCQTMAASGAFADYDWINITPLDTSTRYSLVKQGQLQPLSDIWEQYSDGTTTAYFDTEAGQFFYNHMKLDDDKVYWLSDYSFALYNGKETNTVKGFMIRQDWLDLIGKEIPTTLDELFDDLMEFRKQDVNQSGIEDEVISLNYSRFNTSIAQWFGLVVDTVWYDQNGKVTSPWYQDHVKDYISFMQKLYANDLMIKGDSTHLVSNVLAGEMQWAWEDWDEPQIIIPEGAAFPWFVPFDLEAVEGVAPCYQGAYKFNTSVRGYAVPANSDKQEAIAALLDYIITPEFDIKTEYGIEGLSYEVMDDGVLATIMDSTLENVDQIGMAVWTNNSIFPRINVAKDEFRDLKNNRQLLTRYAELHGVDSNVDGKYNYGVACYEDTSRQINISDVYAVPTVEEANRIAELSTDLNTYSEELLTKLIMGEQSLDDWDTYMQDLKDLGLDELISINQGRYDRAMK